MPEIIINSFSVAICFLIGMLAIFYLPFNKRGNFWFGIFLVSLGFALLSKIIWQEGLDTKFPYIIPVSELSRFVVAPSFYLSIWYYTHLSKISLGKKVLHFIPTLVFILLISVPYFLSLGNTSDLIGERASRIVGGLMRIVLPVQLIAYWILSYQLLKRHRKGILLFSSQKKERDLKWLQSILIWMLFIIVLFLIMKIKESSFLNSVSTYFYLVLTLFMVYNLLRQKEVFLNDKNENATLENIIYPNIRFQTEKPASRLNEEELLKYKSILNNLLENDEVFTDSEINLASLAGKVGISMNDVSFMINNSYNMNFYALINNYRIEKVKEMLTKKQYNHLTILGIAYEAGFTSKSTFNNIFKKTTGLTPSEYMKKNNPKEV
ncbi:AraC-like DNA-binding protein [Flavobacterium sp. 90]|uniref:helix-turn-helix domain-containing protein n=1 Tax=unclassified Flavobacterium TaxID=196869 RepID=UPI000EAC63C2|nr:MULTISPECIES: helix-turn-helix domain-containing protein [unclassified Flavobacterium]RKR11093.1 AraC-like DNA-binding protein [Flavobacterium sp. 81]TCK54876.1 AraC-like DNA-binding protein [Flavobacterium sp. 90]